jgi:hypothetical protein
MTPGRSTTHIEENDEEMKSSPDQAVRSSPRLNMDQIRDAAPTNNLSRVNEFAKTARMDLTLEIGDSLESPSNLLPPFADFDRTYPEHDGGPSSEVPAPSPSAVAEQGPDTFQETKNTLKKSSNDDEIWDIPNSSQATGKSSVPAPAPATNRGKKRKQRAKSPVKFDEATQQVEKAAIPTKKSRSARMPIVTALRASVTPINSPGNSSPAVIPAKTISRQPLRSQRKRARSPSPKRKKKQIRSKSPEMSTNPPDEVHPAKSASSAVKMKSESLLHVFSKEQPQTDKEATPIDPQETLVISSDSSSLSSPDPALSSIPMSAFLQESNGETIPGTEQDDSPQDDLGMHMSGALEMEPCPGGDAVNDSPDPPPVAAVSIERGTDTPPAAKVDSPRPTVRTHTGMSGKPIRPPRSIYSADGGNCGHSGQREQPTVKLARKPLAEKSNNAQVGVIAVAS